MQRQTGSSARKPKPENAIRHRREKPPVLARLPVTVPLEFPVEEITDEPAFIARLHQRALGLAEEAIATIAEIMRDPEQPGSVRIAAAGEILTRSLGKPKQAVSLEGSAQMTVRIVRFGDGSEGAGEVLDLTPERLQ